MVFWIDIGFCLLTHLSSLFRLSHSNDDKGGDKKTDYDDYRRTHYRIEYRRQHESRDHPVYITRICVGWLCL